MRSNTTSELSANKQALLKIRDLKQQLQELQDQQSSGFDPIAIVSMACRFPRRSRTPEDFWQSLIDQTDEVTEIPPDRWDLDAFYDEDPDVPGTMYARNGVFLEHLDLMDPEFFGISPREATWVDPQQRLLLEVGWEALERAGWTPEKIGDHTGIFVGWMHNDYQNEASDSFLNLNPYIATGAAGSFLCGRLAYYLGLQGPSVAVDTACSSSLVALHMACQSLQQRDCDRALVGGVNAICSPTTNILTCKLKALSPSGHSRAFDAAADGYLRGEGCGVVTLRRLSDARQDGDPILGIIRGSAVGHNGFSSGLTAPNPKAQEKVIRQALRRGKVEPHEVAYLEAHGTGTELGDPIEMQAAAAALASSRPADNPLLVGSVKTNIGHLEAAAGMAGLIKVLLAIENDRIPGQLNFENPNPHIAWDKTAVKVLTEVTDWPQTDRRIAGVSAFGMSGTNAHVIVEAPSQTGPDHHASASDNAAKLIVISGKSEEAVQTIAENLERTLASDLNLPVADVAFTTSCGREHFQQRAAMVVRDHTQAIKALKTISRGGHSESAFIGSGRRPPKIAWQFTGQGSQYVGMAKGLYESEQALRDAMDHCDRLLRSWRDESLIEVLFTDSDKIHHTRWTQPCIFAVQMGLAKLLESRGLLPDVVLGHSVGQYAAACVAGVMSWDDGLHLISERGRLIGELPAGGQMLAVFAPLTLIEKELGANQEISLAAINGTHIVISGPESEIGAIEAIFEQRGIRCKPLATSHAFHSKLMDPALEPFRQIADRIEFKQAHLPLICNVTGTALDAKAILNGQYWADHIRRPVQFSKSVQSVQELGCELLLELGPQSVLTRMASADWQQSADRLISCLHQDADDSESFLKAIAQLYVHGAAPDFDAMHADSNCRRLRLPTYPFQRRRFWGPAKPRASHAEYHTAHPLLGSKVSLAGTSNETRYESFIEPDSPSWLPDHEVMGHVVLPGAAYLEMAIAACGSSQLNDLVFEQPLRPTSRTALQTILRAAEEQQQTIEIFSSASETTQWSRNFSAKVNQDNSEQPQPVKLAKHQAACTEEANPKEFYARMQELGLNYGPQFQTIDSLRYSSTEVLAHLTDTADIRGFSISPTLLDGALHSLAVGLLRTDDEHLFLPVGMRAVRCYQPAEQQIWCHARWTDQEGKLRTADLTLFNEQGDVIVKIDQLQLQKISGAALRQISGAGVERLLYDLQWQNFRLPPSEITDKHWLVVQCSEAKSLGSALAKQLLDRGNKAVTLKLSAGSEFSRESDTSLTMCGESTDHWDQLFEEISQQDTDYVPDGIVWIFDQDQDAAGLAKSAALSTATQANCTSLLNLIQSLQRRGIRQIECGLQLITTDAIAVGSEVSCDADQTKYWGIGRVIGAEQPEFRCRLIDVESEKIPNAELVGAVVDILLTETRDNQLAVRDAKLLVPRMSKVLGRNQDDTTFATNPQGCYLITGGLGVLGLQAAKWLADHGAKQIVLVSRRTPDEATQDFLDQIIAGGCQVIVHSADFSSHDDVQAVFQRFGADLNPLSGAIHAAGVLDDALVGEQNWQRFEPVLSPKIIGARLLHEFTKTLPLDFFILYSSAASVLGSPGQSNYATANAFLDGLAWQRRSQGLPAISINWGPWSAGMADDERIVKRLKLQGIVPLGIAEAHRAMEMILSADIAQAVVMDVDWRRLRTGPGGDPPAMLEGLVSARQKSQQGDSQLVGKLKQLRGNARKDLLTKTIQESMQRILSTPELPEVDRPLIEMGLDSLMAVEFSTELQMMIGEQFIIGPTMLFEHPSIDAISDHVLELIESESAAATTTDQAVPGQQQEVADKHLHRIEREPIAVIGMSCRFPGAQNVDQFWNNILSGVDSVGEIPDDRWDIDQFYSAEREPGKMYTRQGGFLEDIGDFDAAFFNISDQEACWIDPQHRMLLENSYRALENAGICPHPLVDSNVGVFMGIMGQDYAFLPRLDDQEIIRTFQGAGLSHSAGVGRISYVFGLEGPSIAVDTASSSSLVALYQAVRSLQDGNCNMALAGGVNAILAPVNSLLMSKAGLLSPDGRCKSFSASADGFGRGEGCGVVVLKRLSDAQRDGDRIMAVVRGGAVVHNGFTGGITSPSGKSQARAISQALQDAQVAPSQIQYLEAHGTGTELGDPMELAAAASVYGKGRKREDALLVGSVKANISHLEAAGGISGLMKTVLSLHHGVIPPQVHFDQPSPHVPWKRLPIKVVTEKTDWPDVDERFAAVTALGLVGTNAHVILSGAPAENDSVVESSEIEDQASATERSAQLLVLSARSKAALIELAQDYQQFIAEHSESTLAEICHTAAVGRRHFEHRIALTVSSRAAALQKLKSIVETESPDQVLVYDDDSGRSANGKIHPKANCQSMNGSIQHGVARGITKAAPKLAWVFTGDRNSELGVARQIYATEPVFRELIDSFNKRLSDHFGAGNPQALQLSNWLSGETADDADFLPPTDVHLFALQSGLARLWHSWGIKPDAVTGFGVGQYAAACVAGSLAWEDALMLVVHRETAINQIASQRDGKDHHEKEHENFDENQTTALEQFEANADTFNYYPPNLQLVCSLSGKLVPVHRSLGGSYWRKHLTDACKSLESLDALAELSTDWMMELGPDRLETTDELSNWKCESTEVLSTLDNDRDATSTLLDALGQLYVSGVNPDFVSFDRHWTRQRIRLPNYPFQKSRYWITEVGQYSEPKQTVSHEGILNDCKK